MNPEKRFFKYKAQKEIPHSRIKDILSTNASTRTKEFKRNYSIGPSFVHDVIIDLEQVSHYTMGDKIYTKIEYPGSSNHEEISHEEIFWKNVISYYQPVMERELPIYNPWCNVRIFFKNGSQLEIDVDYYEFHNSYCDYFDIKIETTEYKRPSFRPSVDVNNGGQIFYSEAYIFCKNTNKRHDKEKN